MKENPLHKQPDGKPAATATPVAADLQTEKLRESEARYRALFDKNTDGILIADIETRMFKYANPALCRMLGYTEDELRTMSVPDIHPKDAVQNVAAEFEAQVRGDKTLATDVPCLKKDGSVVYVDINATQITVDGGPCNVGFFRNTTERKRAEEEIERTAREWQTTFDATKDAIWILDENHRILRSNKTAESYFKRPCSEMLGKPCWEIMYGATEPVPDCPSVRARKSGNRETMDWQRDERWFEVIVDPILDAAGQHAGAIHIVSDITPRKRAEEEMRRQSLVINQTSETVVITDLDGIITDVNAAQCRALGQTREELIGKSVVDVFGGTPARNALQREIIETTHSRGQWFGEITNVSATGEATIVECRTWLLRNEQGKAIGMFGVGTDITARKQTEAALRDSRALYYSLVENLPQSIFRKDRAGRFQFVNERFCRDLKRSVVDIIGRTDVDFFPSELAQAYRLDDLRVMETGQTLDQEEKHVGADGRETFVHVLKTPLRDARGQITGIQGVFWDITPRKRAEAALRESEEKHRVLIETTATGFVIVDAQGRVLDANDEYVRLSGHEKREQIVGRSVTEWTAEHDQARNAAEVRKCIASGSVRGLEVDYVHPDGTVIPIEVNASTLGAGGDLKIVTL